MFRSLKIRGLSATIEKWENHWANALLDTDLEFLVFEAHCNHVRLPIGFFTLGPEFCTGTQFRGAPSQVYPSAWAHVLAMCSKLAKCGISVLIDMHALPGSANESSHSGTTASFANLWGSPYYLGFAEKCILFVAREIAAGKIPNCAGFQICNEAIWQAKGMYDFYANMLFKISEIDISIPIYISDAWNLGATVDWIQRYNTTSSRTNLMIIDTHEYYTFDEKHTSKTPPQLLGLVSAALKAADHVSGNVHRYGAVPLYVGEYSCVMDRKSWSDTLPRERAILTQMFGLRQCRTWLDKACGSAFWTLKMDWMPGGDWGFVEQTRKHCIEAPGHLSLQWDEVTRRIAEAEVRKSQIWQKAVVTHNNYWDDIQTGEQYEHWRFEDGWNDGWNDALAFFGMRKACRVGVQGGDKIGCLDGWIRKRLVEARQLDRYGWEYEHGFRDGVKEAEVILLR